MHGWQLLVPFLYAACGATASAVSDSVTAYSSLYTNLSPVGALAQQVAGNRTAFLSYAAAAGLTGLENVTSGAEHICYDSERAEVNCTTLHVLVLTPLSSRETDGVSGASAAISGAMLWQFVNSAQKLLPGYVIKPDFVDSHGHERMVYRILIDLMAREPNKYVMVLCANGNDAVAAATVGPGYRLMVLAGGARTFDVIGKTPEFPYFFRTHSGAMYRVKSYPLFVQLCGYTRLALVSEDSEDGIVASQLFEERFVSEGVNITFSTFIPKTYAFSDLKKFDFVMDMSAGLIRTSRTRVVVSSVSFMHYSLQFMCEMYRRNLGGLVMMGSSILEYKFPMGGGTEAYLKYHHIQCTYPELKALYLNMLDLTGGMWLTARFAGEQEGPLDCLPQYHTNQSLMWGRSPFVQGVVRELVKRFGRGPAAPPANTFGNAACVAAMALRNYLIVNNKSAIDLKARTPEAYEALANATESVTFRSFDGVFRYRKDEGWMGPRYAHSLRTVNPDNFGAYDIKGMLKDSDATLLLFAEEKAVRHAGVAKENTFEYVWKPGLVNPGSYKIFLVKRGGPPPREQRSQCASQELPTCPPGSIYSHGTTVFGNEGWGCVPCLAGEYQDGWECKLCPAGEHSSARSTECKPCLPGTYSAAPGSENCTACELGRFIAEARKTACAECEAGRFHHDAVRCEPCPVGTYGSMPGLAVCSACLGNLKTRYPGSTNASECACDAGSYMVTEGVGPEPQCKACPKGIKCSTFGDMPLVDEGYFMFPSASRFAEELDLYKCMPASVCPGQKKDISDPVCGEYMTGLNCGLCQDGYTRSGAECVPCSDRSWILPVFFVVLFLVCGVFHGLWNRKSAHVEAGETVLASVTLGMTLGFIQQIGIFDRLRFSWPDEFQDIMNFLGVFLFELDILAPSCFFSQGLSATYVTSMMLPFVWTGIFFSWLPISQLLNRITSGFLPKFKLTEIVNTLGMVIQAIFIAISATTIRLLECYENPNGVKTIRRFPYETCAGDEYWKMMPLCIFGIVFYIFGIIALFTYASLVAPRYFVNKDFRVAIRFLVFKYAPNRWWYGIILLLRSLILAMVTVIEPQDGSIQFFLMLGTLIAALFVHLVLLPYSDQFANNLESVELCLLMAILGFGSWYITDRNPELDDDLAILLTSLFIVCAVTLFAVFLYACAVAQCPEKARDMHHGKVKEVLPKLRAMCTLVLGKTEQDLFEVLENATYIDRGHVYEMVAFLLLELEGIQSRSFSLMRLPTVTSSCEIVSKKDMKIKLEKMSSSENLASVRLSPIQDNKVDPEPLPRELDLVQI